MLVQRTLTLALPPLFRNSLVICGAICTTITAELSLQPNQQPTRTPNPRDCKPASWILLEALTNCPRRQCPLAQTRQTRRLGCDWAPQSHTSSSARDSSAVDLVGPLNNRLAAPRARSCRNRTASVCPRRSCPSSQWEKRNTISLCIFTADTLFWARPLIACCCWSRDRYDLEARLRKQELFPGGSQLCVVGSDGLTCGHQSQCRHGAKRFVSIDSCFTLDFVYLRARTIYDTP